MLIFDKTTTVEFYTQVVLQKQIPYTVINIRVGTSWKQVRLTGSPAFCWTPLAKQKLTAMSTKFYWLNQRSFAVSSL